MDAENEKLFKEYRNLIKNKNISLEVNSKNFFTDFKRQRPENFL